MAGSVVNKPYPAILFLNKILRGYLGFDGVVVSDYGAVGYASQKGNPDILKQRAVEALTAVMTLNYHQITVINICPN